MVFPLRSLHYGMNKRKQAIERESDFSLPGGVNGYALFDSRKRYNSHPMNELSSLPNFSCFNGNGFQLGIGPKIVSACDLSAANLLKAYVGFFCPARSRVRFRILFEQPEIEPSRPNQERRWHPFRVQCWWEHSSGGVAALNHRLIADNPYRGKSRRSFRTIPKKQTVHWWRCAQPLANC
jgi:hypothetical protein